MEMLVSIRFYLWFLLLRCSSFMCFVSIFPVPPTSIATSISIIGPPVAGYNFSITCSATVTEGIVGVPVLAWTDSNGRPIGSTGDITLNDQVTSGQMTNRTLFFDPIRTSDEGSYICTATLSSPALTVALNSTTLYTIDVQQSKFKTSLNNLSPSISCCSSFSFCSFPNSSEHNGLQPRPGPHLCPRVCCNADMQGRWSIRPGGHHLDIHVLWKMLRAPTGNAAVNHDGPAARRRRWKPHLFGGG